MNDSHLFMCVSGEYCEPQEYSTSTGMLSLFPLRFPPLGIENAEKELRCQIPSAAL